MVLRAVAMSTPDADALTQIVALERELHRPRTRRDRSRLVALLHPEFQEVGHSGARYDLEQVIAALVSDRDPPKIEADDIQAQALAADVVLVTYRTRQIVNDRVERQSLRASVWILETGRWQLRYHQGTPSASP